MITYRDIDPKPRKLYGNLYQPKETASAIADGNTHHADVIPGKSIRIFGVYRNHTNGPQNYDRTFNIGDWAEYDSYNLNYTGKIVAIGKNFVTIDASDTGRSCKRLDLHTFSWRNWDFDLKKIAEHNFNEMQCI